jgi:hypothetical protein
MISSRRASASRALEAASVALAASTLAVAAPGVALADGALRFYAGVEYTSGDYGGTEDIEDVYVPVTLAYGLPRVDLRLTVPYLEVKSGPDVTESGLGDVIGAITVYDVFRSNDGTLMLDFTGKVKLGTADETAGLGSGETDYSLQADVYKALGRSGFSTGLGYKARGDTAYYDLENAWFGYVGGVHAFSARTVAELYFDYRQPSVADNDAVRELSAAFTRRTSGPWSVRFYVIKGLSDTSPDWGTGLSMRANF